MKNKIIINVGSAFAILILIFIMFLSHWQMTRLAFYEQEDGVIFDVIQKLDHLLSILREVRKDGRSFINSGEDKYFELYKKSLNKTRNDLMILNNLTNSNQLLQKQVKGIELHVEDKLAEIGEQIRRPRPGDSQAATNGDLVKVRMVEIHELVAAAKEEAVTYMRQLAVKQEADFKKMEYLLIVNSTIICILVITVFLILKREIASRIKMNEHVVMLQEQERLALSREVHDDIGQNLTALKLDLTLIENRLHPTDSELTGQLVEMRANLDQLLAKTNDITAKLRPPLLDNLGLAAALEWQVDEFRRRSSIEYHLMLNEDIKVYDSYVALTILRIFQEALTNIIRHAQATEVSISLCQRGDEFILEISDNGCGIYTKDIDSLNSYGIMGMRERAALCNGKVVIKGSPVSGTIVSLTIPCDVLKERR